jgi:hypothetical protein
LQYEITFFNDLEAGPGKQIDHEFGTSCPGSDYATSFPLTFLGLYAGNTVILGMEYARDNPAENLYTRATTFMGAFRNDGTKGPNLWIERKFTARIPHNLDFYSGNFLTGSFNNLRFLGNNPQHITFVLMSNSAAVSPKTSLLAVRIPLSGTSGATSKTVAIAEDDLKGFISLQNGGFTSQNTVSVQSYRGMTFGDSQVRHIKLP